MFQCFAKFDDSEIRKVFQNATPRFFKAAGAYIRKIAMNSIKRQRNADKYSKPGTPPYYHGAPMPNGLTFKQSILYSAGKDDVVIGPISNGLGVLGQLHEFGGSRTTKYIDSERYGHVFNVGERGPVSTKKFANIKGRTIHGYTDPLTGYPVIDAPLTTTAMAAHASRVNSRILRQYFTKTKQARYPARPFMRPALEKSEPYLLQIFKQQI